MDLDHCHLNCISCPAVLKSVFKDLDQNQSNLLSQKKVVTHFKKGEALFHQGVPTNGMYCIGTGKVKLSKLNVAGEESIFSIKRSGEFIGYQDKLENPEYLTTGTAIENCTACFIPQDYFHEMLFLSPGVAVNLLRQTTKTMETVSSYAHTSVHLNVKNRVANLLVTLGNHFGIESAGKVKIDLRLTRHELASMVGTASETMIRALSELKHQGILEQHGNYIFINDMKKLFKLSNLNP